MGVFLLRIRLIIGKILFLFGTFYIYTVYYIFARLHTDTHKHAYIHTYIHIHRHEHTHTFTWYFVYSDGNQIGFVIGKLFFKKVNLRRYHGS